MACAMRKAAYTAPGNGTDSSTIVGAWRASASGVSSRRVSSTRFGGAARAWAKRVEGGLAARQRFGIAHEFEARIDGVAHHIGQIVQVQGGQVLGAILQAQRAKCPAQGSPPSSSTTSSEQKRGPSGRNSAAHDAVRQGRVAALQKRDHRA